MNQRLKISEKEFKRKLKLAIEENGFLFPTTEIEVDKFEQKSGTTEIEVPVILRSPDCILEKLSGKSDDVLAFAAREGKNTLPNSLIDQMFNDWSEAKTAADERKKKRN